MTSGRGVPILAHLNRDEQLSRLADDSEPWDLLVIGGALHPRPLAEEIDYLIRHVGGYLEERPTHGDIRAIFAGLHPLAKPPRVRAGRKSTAALSRGYVLYASDSGLVTVTGGKWTTCRQMAEEAVDRAAEMGDCRNGAR